MTHTDIVLVGEFYVAFEPERLFNMTLVTCPEVWWEIRGEDAEIALANGFRLIMRIGIVAEYLSYLRSVKYVKW